MFRFSRFSFKLEIPFIFSNMPTTRGIAVQSCIFGISVALVKFSNWMKKRNPRRKKKLERTNKIRLIEHRSGFNMFVSDIHQISDKSLNRESRLIQKYFLY